MILTAKAREQAHQIFLKQGIPSKKEEAWKYTSLKKLTVLDLVPSVASKNDQNLMNEHRHSKFHQIFVVNGQLFARASDKKKLAGALQISRKYKTLNKIFRQARKESGKIRQESLEALNFYHSQPLNIFVKPGSHLKKPLQIVFLSNSSGAQYPRIQLVVGKNAKMDLIETYVSSDKKHFTDAVTEIVLEASSQLKYLRVQTENKQTIHFGCTRVFLKENSNLESLTYATGAEISRHNLDIHCLGAAAKASVNGLTLGGGEQHFDNSTLIDHVVGNCITEQLYKSLLAGKSKAVFRGQVEIRPGAQKAFSDQLNKNLLISKEAEADSIPQLNIYADDVKATHGSTVGQISEEEIFYLLSRAIDRDKAIELLSLGFVKDLVDRVSDLDTRHWLLKNLEASYRGLQ